MEETARLSLLEDVLKGQDDRWHETLIELLKRWELLTTKFPEVAQAIEELIEERRPKCPK